MTEQDKQKIVVRVECDLCQANSRGTKKELGERGWKKAVIWPGGKKKTITRCPEHKEGYDELVGNAFKKRLKLSTKIGGITIKGGATMTGDITIRERNIHITGDMTGPSPIPTKQAVTVSGDFQVAAGTLRRRPPHES